MKHLMVDIESLGTKPGAPILSITAVQFDLYTGKIGEVFDCGISLKDCTDNGLIIDPDTAVWWMEQDQEARESILQKIKEGKPLKEACMNFNTWMLMTFGGNDFEIWGNSNRFDLGIIEHAMIKVNVKPAWNPFNERDVRTLVSFDPSYKHNAIFEGVKHNGEYDCRHQIKYCHETIKNKDTWPIS